MIVGLILVALAILAVVAVVVINRSTGARPDRPMEGAEHDTATVPRDEGNDGGTSRRADHPSGPAQESMNPARSGDPSPGPRGE